MKAKIGGREVELNIEDRLASPISRTVVPNKPQPHGDTVRGKGLREHGTGHASHAGRHTAEQGVTVGTAQPIKTVKASPPSPYYPYKNKLEKAFATQLDAEWRAGAIKGWLYEPFSFKLAEGKRYRVDFVSWGEEGVVCWETKGWHANIRDSLTHLKWAAQRFPFFKWKKAIRKRGMFESMDIVV